MDKEILDAISAQLLHAKMIIESAIDQLDVETSESQKMGKMVALDFDDSDLINVQVSVDEVVMLLQNLSTELSTF